MTKKSNIWEIDVPFGTEFADLMCYDWEEAGDECPSCGVIPDPDVPVKSVEWQPGSDVVSDFVAALGAFILRESIADDLIARFNGIGKRTIEFFDHPNLYRPKGRKAAIKRRVWLPYDGPALCELVVTHAVSLNARSTVVVENECQICGNTLYKRFNGVEAWNGAVHVPRMPGAGLFVSRKAIGDNDFFRPKNTGLFLCSDRVKRYIESAGYSNVRFLEYGEII